MAKGSGPGGQSVNKTNNAVRLKHLPTSVSVRCHETRSLDANRKIALAKLASAVDVHVNGEESVQRQIQRLESERKKWKEEEKARKREAKRLSKLHQEESKSGENTSEDKGR